MKMFLALGALLMLAGILPACESHHSAYRDGYQTDRPVVVEQRPGYYDNGTYNNGTYNNGAYNNGRHDDRDDHHDRDDHEEHHTDAR